MSQAAQDPTRPAPTRTLTTAAAIAVALILSLLIASPAQAATKSITITGSVTCTNSQAVKGVWVSSSAGGSAFASWWAFPGKSTAAYFSQKVTFTGTSTKVRLDVGCGGTTASWWSTKSTPTITLSSGKTLNATCTATTSGKSQSCAFPTTGTKSSSNTGVSGYCTWGAYEKWKGATGFYPNFNGGNAKQWDDSGHAAANGWKVTATPSKRAIIVINSGTYGHVGWVTGLAKNTSGQVVITFVDMNGGGGWIDEANGITADFGVFKTRTRTWTSSSTDRFILAPWS